MPPDENLDKKRATNDTAATSDSISEQISSANEDVLRALIDTPAFDETRLYLILERKDLSGALLEEIAKKNKWSTIYRVRRALAAHPHTPRLVAMRMLRDLHLVDLVRISLTPGSPAELRRLAEERVLVQLPQLSLGHRLTLALRASGRVAAGLLECGPEQVARIALENSFMTESQLLKTLAKDSITVQVIALVAAHEKWSKLVNVRLALLRHANSPMESVLVYVPHLGQRDISDLLDTERLPAELRHRLRDELIQRSRR